MDGQYIHTCTSVQEECRFHLHQGTEDGCTEYTETSTCTLHGLRRRPSWKYLINDSVPSIPSCASSRDSGQLLNVIFSAVIATKLAEPTMMKVHDLHDGKDRRDLARRTGG
jgi:hypothetical protein